MNELLAQPINISKAMKFLLIAMLLFCLCPVLINCLVLVPIYASISSDVLYSSSPIPVIIKYVQDFLDLTAFSVSYTLIIFSVLLISKKHAKKTVLIYTLVFFLKIPIKLLMNVPLYGSLGSFEDIIFDLIYLGVYFSLEMLQLLAVYIFASFDANKHLKKTAFQKADKKAIASDQRVLPFTKLLSFGNPLQRSAFKMALLISGIKIFSRILTDITYGAPASWGEVLIMIVYYLSDLLYGVIAYIIAMLVFNASYEILKTNKNTDEEVSPSVLE